MAENFDVKAEASKIQQMAFSCLDDNSAGLKIKAANTETAIAKELASIWGKPDKLEAVAAEFQRSAPTWGLHQARVDIGDKPTDVVGFDFMNVNYRSPDFGMSVKKVGEDVVVTVGGTKDDMSRPENRFGLKSTDYSVTSPISYEK